MCFAEHFKWINKGDIRFEGDKIIMNAPAMTDFFCGADTSSKEGILPESLCGSHRQRRRTRL